MRREASLNAMVEDANSNASRTARTNYSDHEPEDLDQAGVVADEDEPDAPTYVPQTPRAPHATVAAPELTHPGESQSNGASERAVQMVEDLARTCKLALESRLKLIIPMPHPITAWLAEHAAATLTPYNVHEGGPTGSERRHGTRTRENISKFCKTVA